MAEKWNILEEQTRFSSTPTKTPPFSLFFSKKANNLEQDFINLFCNYKPMMQNLTKTPPPDKCRHLWKWDFVNHIFRCLDCDATCEFYCYVCDQPIPREEIPKEAFEKLSTQIYYHEACLGE